MIMETNDLVTDSIEDAITVKSEPYFICLEDNWITIDSEVPVADPGIHVPENELIIKDEPPTDGEYFEPDLPSVKNEPLESGSTNLLTALDYHLWREHQPDPASIGNMGITIRETSMCRNSTFTGWHLLRSAGLMTLILRSNNLNCENLLRLAIKRRNPEYSSYHIDRVCDKHQADATFSPDHVLHPGPSEQNWMLETRNRERSLVYLFDKYQTSKKLEIRIICNDTCRTSTDKNFKSKEKSRDAVLEITVETKDNKTILERDFIQVWTKAAIKPSDLEKKVRRESKGSVAIREKRERLLALKDAKVGTKAGNIIKRAYTALRSLGFSDKEILFMVKKEVAKHKMDHKHSSL